MPRLLLTLSTVLVLGFMSVHAQELTTRLIVLDREVWDTPTWPVRGFLTPLSAVHGPAGEGAHRGLVGEMHGAKTRRLPELESLLGTVLGWEVVEELEFEDLFPLFQVRGPADVVASVEGAVRQFEDTLPRYQVQAVRFGHSAWSDIAGAVIAVDQLAELRGKHPVEEDLTGYARSEGGVRLTAARWRSVVYDLDIETTGSGVVADPLMGVVPLGSELVVRPWALDAGRVLLRVDGRRGDLREEPRRRESGGALVLDQKGLSATVSLGAVQCLRAGVSSFGASGVLAPGQALVVGDRDGTSGPWILSLSAGKAPVASGDQKVQVLHTAELTTPWSPPTGLPHRMTPSGVYTGLDALGDSAAGARRPRTLKAPLPHDDLRITLGLDEDEHTTSAQLGSMLFLRGESERLHDLKAQFLALRDQLVQTFELELRWGEVAGDAPLVHASPHDQGQGLTQGARSGDGVRLFSGEQSHHMKDHDVELSQASSGADPVVDVAWTGFAFSGALERLRPDMVRLRGELLHQVSVQELKPFELGGPQGGSLDQLDLAHVCAESHWDLVPGQWTLLQSAPLVGTGRQFLCLARVRVR